jgi:hypothetical protein
VNLSTDSFRHLSHVVSRSHRHGFFLSFFYGHRGAWRFRRLSLFLGLNRVALQEYSVLTADLNEGASAAWLHTTVGGMRMNPSYEVMPYAISIGRAAWMGGSPSYPPSCFLHCFAMSSSSASVFGS